MVCHGDFGPWNLIWIDGVPSSVIDFDNAHPGPRMEDVGYALWKFEIEKSPGALLRGYGLPLDARDAVDYAKQRERERFTQNGWPITFYCEPLPFGGVTLPFWPARSRSACSSRTASSDVCSSSTSRRIRSRRRRRGEDLLLRLQAEVDAGRELPHEIG